MLANQSIYTEEKLLLSAAAALTLLGAAGAAIRATHALLAAFLGTVYIEPGKTQDQYNNSNNDNIFHRLIFIYATGAFLGAFALWHRWTITAANTATTTRPGRKPAPTDPVVTRVPI